MWESMTLEARNMGEVRVKITLTNAVDQTLVRRGHLHPARLIR